MIEQVSIGARVAEVLILCETCGNKRCPHAGDHRYVCTVSNEPGQRGSTYEHILEAGARCTCGAEHDRRGTGESGFSWFERHLAEATANPAPEETA